MDDFYIKLINLKKIVESLLDEKKLALDIYDINALNSISNELGQIAYECRTRKMKPKDKRFPYIGRILADRDDSLISSELGRELITVEKKYIEM